MRVNILMVGKIAEKPYQSLVEQYLTRCRNRLPVDLVSCRDLADMRRRLPTEEVVVLDERGDCLTSRGMADWLQRKMNAGHNRLTFCLGPAEGLDDAVRSAATETMALSRLTLNHQLALLVLSEQLYRGMSILFGEPYHKA
jgi:23S rRNA (pseudouridine1915-N3)-methyltransferase